MSGWWLAYFVPFYLAARLVLHTTLVREERLYRYALAWRFREAASAGRALAGIAALGVTMRQAMEGAQRFADAWAKIASVAAQKPPSAPAPGALPRSEG